jgi:hypothetical protein
MVVASCQRARRIEGRKIPVLGILGTDCSVVKALGVVGVVGRSL